MMKKLPQLNLSIYLFIIAVVSVVGIQTIATAQNTTASTAQEDWKIVLNTVWVLFTGSLVFFMNCGFAMLETGFCQRDNAINVLAKNLIVFAIATVSFWFFGFGLMFGDGSLFVGGNGFFLQGLDNSPATGNQYEGIFSSLKWAAIPLNAKFFFQLTFAGTAATIVSGAVAERIKFPAFLWFSLIFIISYSITGHWVWGGGFLAILGFRDFAGSTVVHSVGGWAALMGAWLLGPRRGKYLDWELGEIRRSRNSSLYGNKMVTLSGHNLSLSTLGCFILWLGWYGFNAGSTLTADHQAISHILLATLIAGAFGGLSATFWAWWFYNKPSLSFIINGILAGCVSITASCAFVSLYSAAIIGFVGGGIVLWASIWLDKLEIDDPVGAVAVHLACGIWGTAAVGLFSLDPQVYAWSAYFTQGDDALKGGLLFGGGFNLLFVQLLGILFVGAFTVLYSFFAWFLIGLVLYYQTFNTTEGYRANKGLRVTLEEEKYGLDSLFEEGETILKPRSKDTKNY